MEREIDLTNLTLVEDFISSTEEIEDYVTLSIAKGSLSLIYSINQKI